MKNFQRKPITELQRRQGETAREQIRLSKLPPSSIEFIELTEKEKKEQDKYIKLHNCPF
jgi:hypothetical protein